MATCSIIQSIRWIALLLMLQAAISSSWAAAYKPTQKDLSSQICIERPENNGSVNITASHVVFSNHQELTLIGGQAACLFVAAGVYFFVVQSINPYDPESTNSQAWISQEMKVQAKRGGVGIFEVEPKSEGAAYVGGWIVRPIKK